MDYGLRVAPNNYSEKDRTINLKGCYSFSVRNIGAVTAIIFGIVEIGPGQEMSFPNEADLPYAENSSLEWGTEIGPKKIQVLKSVKVEFKPCEQ
jgi:hypothetical protein